MLLNGYRNIMKHIYIYSPWNSPWTIKADLANWVLAVFAFRSGNCPKWTSTTRDKVSGLPGMIVSSETRAKMAKMHVADMGASKSGATATPKMLILKEAANLKFEMVLHSFRFQDFHHCLCIFGDYGTAGISALKHWWKTKRAYPQTWCFETLWNRHVDTTAVLVLLVLYTIKLHPMISYAIISHLTITHYISLYPSISHDIPVYPNHILDII